MNCGFSGLIRVAAAPLDLGKGKINALFVLKSRPGRSGVPGRLGNGIILNKLLMALKALLIDYRLCSQIKRVQLSPVRVSQSQSSSGQTRAAVL